MPVSIWIEWIAWGYYLWAMVLGVEHHRAVAELLHERRLALHSYSTCSLEVFSKGVIKCVDELA